jgi:hypothetical protein
MYASYPRAHSFNLAGVLILCFIVAFLGADGGATGASSQAKSPGVGNADRGVYSSYAAAHDTKQAHKKDTSPTNRTSQKARPDSGRWNTTSPTLTWTPKPCVPLPSLLWVLDQYAPTGPPKMLHNPQPPLSPNLHIHAPQSGRPLRPFLDSNDPHIRTLPLLFPGCFYRCLPLCKRRRVRLRLSATQYSCDVGVCVWARGACVALVGA